jgi:hypothetical protein
MLILATTLALSGTLVLFPIPAQPGEAAPTTPREVAPEPKLRLPVNGDFFRGNVTELTQDTITLRLHTDEIRKFPIGSILRSGKYWEGEQPATYRFADVKVGDQVLMYCLELNRELRCETICIRRRPGGRVPPCPGERPGCTRPWHEYANAMQDFEEKGIPLPPKYDPRNMPGTINGIPVPARLLQPGPLPGVPPQPKKDPPLNVNGGG